MDGLLLWPRLHGIDVVAGQIKVLEHFVGRQELYYAVEAILCQVVRRQVQGVSVLVVFQVMKDGGYTLVGQFILYELYKSVMSFILLDELKNVGNVAVLNFQSDELQVGSWLLFQCCNHAVDSLPCLELQFFL